MNKLFIAFFYYLISGHLHSIDADVYTYNSCVWSTRQFKEYFCVERVTLQKDSLLTLLLMSRNEKDMGWI